MAMDTPAKIAILGAGPIGLEAALYARFLGYDVVVFERGAIAEHVRQWGHVRMFSPFGMNSSSLGVAALVAQDENYAPPADDEIVTGRQWVDRYLDPLASSDLLRGNIHTRTEVLRVGRTAYLKTNSPGADERGDDEFQLLYRDADGNEHRERADIVIDCTGVFGQPNWIGPGGVPAIGELRLRNQIAYRVPDVENGEREHYAGKRSLVIGAGYSAATSVVLLADLVKDTGGGVIWLTRQDSEDAPIKRIKNDRLPLRDSLAEKANELSTNGSVQRLAGFWVDRIEMKDDGIHLLLIGREEETEDAIETEDERKPAPLVQREVTVDRIVANVGYRGDNSVTEDLQVHRCYATDGPIKMAAALMNEQSEDCLEQSASGAELLVCPEPNFYLLGSKVFGRNSNFLYRNGLDQIRDLFSLIGERDDLDLYAGAKKLPS